MPHAQLALVFLSFHAGCIPSTSLALPKILGSHPHSLCKAAIYYTVRVSGHAGRSVTRLSDAFAT
jgi:hypothetical protein